MKWSRITRAPSKCRRFRQGGNIKGKKIDGGNIFEGSRSTEYPNPPRKMPYFGSLFRRPPNLLDTILIPILRQSTARITRIPMA